ncbi:MAG: hypothetical protein KF716_20395 [Anaerolineae bacterium]|nr:hypothetical protein [Anaerolineae bacterium]
MKKAPTEQLGQESSLDQAPTLGYNAIHTPQTAGADLNDPLNSLPR